MEEVPPKPGEPEKKTGIKTERLWCGEHMAWTLYSTSECRVKKAREEREKQEKPVVAREATITTPMITQINPNFAAVMATLAQMASQDE